jgi:hypothetical protein
MQTPYGPHAVSALVRKYATMKAISLLYEAGCRKILSVFGSERDLHCSKMLNVGVDPKDQFELTLYRPLVVVKDITRARTGAYPDLSDHDGFILVDIYMWHKENLSAHHLRQLADHGPVYWIGHKFEGVLGTIQNEGAWMRLRDPSGTKELIMSRPDSRTNPYPLHDPCDWLHPGGSLEVDGIYYLWSDHQEVGDTTMVKFVRSASQPEDEQFLGAMSPNLWVPLPEASEWMELFCSFLPNYVVKKIVPTRMALIDRSLLSWVSISLVGKSLTPYSWRQMHALAASKFQSEPRLALLEKLFPGTAVKILQDTVTYGFISDMEKRKNTVKALNVVHGADMAEYNAETKEIGDAKPRNSKIFVAFAAIAFLGVAVLIRRRMMAGSTPTFIVSLWDKIKRFFPTSWAAYCSTKKEQVKTTVVAGKNKIAETYVTVKTKVDENPELVRSLTFLSVNLGVMLAKWALFAGEVVAEESFKRVNPAVGLYFPFFEFFLKLCTWDDFQGVHDPRVLQAMVTIPMHFIATSLPFKYGVAFHLAWNTLCLSKGIINGGGSTRRAALGMISSVVTDFIWRTDPEKPKSFWKEHVAQHYLQPWEDRDAPNPQYVRCSNFDPRDGLVKKDTEPFYDAKPQDLTIKIKGALLADPEEPASEIIAFIVPTSAVGRAPSRSTANLLGMIDARITAAPPLEPRAQAKAWDKVELLHTDDWMRCPIVWESHVEEWLEHFSGNKRKRAERAVESLQKHGIRLEDKECHRVDLFVKTNELLFQRNCLGQSCLKPRPVANVSPIVQACVGPYITEATKRLHLLWSWGTQWTTPACYMGERNIPVYVTFGCDANDALLSGWYASAPLCDFIAVLVAGDDFLIRSRIDGVENLYEGDVSQCDQSLSYGPLRLEYAFLRQLGVPDFPLDVMEAVSAAPYVCKTKDGAQMVIIHRPMRTTGGPDTTIGNSVVIGHALCHAICKCTFKISHMIMDGAMQKLGLKIKWKFPRDITHATFLKGAWYKMPRPVRLEYDDAQIDCDYVWGPLPSRILKMGKSLVDPRTIYGIKDLNKAGAMFLADIAQCYSRFVRVPLVGDFVERVIELQLESTGKKLEDTAPWKVQASQAESPGWPEDWDAMSERYGIEAEEWETLRATVKSMTPWSFLEHPGFEKLVRADYA